MSSNQPKIKFINIFLENRGFSTEHVTLDSLAGDGSRRTYHRVRNSLSNKSFIIMENRPENRLLQKENISYLRIGEHLAGKGLPVPEILSYDLNNGWFILEDMGDKHLNDDQTPQTDYGDIYQRVTETLFRLQTEGSNGFKTEWCYQTKYYNQSVMRKSEADYFRDSFLINYIGLKKENLSLDKTFDYLAETASSAENSFFLHRDFQARNIMLNNGRIGIIDWQGGRLGPLGYDLASLMIEAYKLTEDKKQMVFDNYLQMLKDYIPDTLDNFREYYPYLAIQRNLQILGAFSFLSKVQKKAQFKVYIGPALRSLNRLLDELADPGLSLLKDILKSIQIDETGKLV